MLSRTFPRSVSLKLLMNTLPPLLEMGHSLTSTTHPTTTNNLLINAYVRYDAINTSTPSKRRYVYADVDTQDFTLIEEPHETTFSQDIDTPSDDFYQLHPAKHNKTPSKSLSGFQRDHSQKTTPSTPKKPFK